MRRKCGFAREKEKKMLSEKGEKKSGLPSRLSASFTVEAAFIVPILFAIILGLLQLGLMLHDRVAAEGLINDTLFQVREQLEGKTDGKVDFARLSKSRMFFHDDKTILKSAQEYLETNASKTFLISSFRNLDIEKGITQIKITADLKSKSILPGWGFFNEKTGKVHYEITMPLVGKEEKTRLVSVVFEELVRYGLVR